MNKPSKLICPILTLAILFFSCTNLFALPVMLYGTVTVNNQELTAEDNDYTICGWREADDLQLDCYTMGSNPEYLNYYQIYIPNNLGSILTDPEVAEGERYYITINDVRINEGDNGAFTLTQHGASINLDISATIDPLPGDCDGNGVVDLRDAILALKIVVGISPAPKTFSSADVNEDGKIGLAEATYILNQSRRL